MEYEFLYTPFPNPKVALRDLNEKLKSREVEPSLGIFFLTGNLIDYHKQFSDLLNCNTVCIPVEGYVKPPEIWMRGAALLLLDAKYRLYRFHGSTERVCDLMSAAKKYRSNILVYPVFNFVKRLDVIQALFRERRYHWSYSRGDKSALVRASKFLEDKMVYPINKMLIPFRDKGLTAVSLNIFPMEVKYGHPLISVNGKKLGRGVVMISLRDDIGVTYSDTMPERGKNPEETMEILKNEYDFVERVKVEKAGVTVGYVNGKPAVEYIKEVWGFVSYQYELGSEVDTDLKTGKFFGSSPYGYGFISEETYGHAILGVLDYPLKLYPSLFNLDKFSEDALAIVVESSREGWNEKLERIFEEDNSNIFFIDQHFVLLYRDNISDLLRYIHKDSIGVFTSYPGLTSPNLGKNYMTEVDKKICMNLTSTAILMEV
jgi:hypothetical protein